VLWVSNAQDGRFSVRGEKTGQMLRRARCDAPFDVSDDFSAIRGEACKPLEQIAHR
jgi:hypothetical protein